jgi:ribosomal protein S18 acetylase RimI-like enzyme
MLTTRPAADRDIEDILRLLPQLFEDDAPAEALWARNLRQVLDSERGGVLVVEEDGTVLGVITSSYNLSVRHDGGYAQVEELVVDERARGRDAGAILVRAAIEEARRRGCAEIGLYSRETTRGFYEKQGFVYAGPELRQPLR